MRMCICWAAEAVYRMRKKPSLQQPAPIPGPALGNFSLVPYPAVALLSRPWNGKNCASALYTPLAKLRPDVVLNYWLYPEGYAALSVGKALGLPVVVGARGSDLRRVADRFTRKRVKITLGAADSVLLVSTEMRQWALDLGAPAEKTRVILNGCDQAVFYPGDREAARAACGVEKRERVILFVGRLIRPKGVIELLEAFAALAAESADLRLVFLGDGVLAGYVAEFTRRQRLTGRIHPLQLPLRTKWRVGWYIELLCLG